MNQVSHISECQVLLYSLQRVAVTVWRMYETLKHQCTGSTVGALDAFWFKDIQKLRLAFNVPQDYLTWNIEPKLEQPKTS